jgi:hypothetical protein
MGKTCDIVKGLYDALGKGDVPAVLGAFDPQIQWREAENFLYADGNPYRRTTCCGRRCLSTLRL